mgnify:CR=1 FL=1
MFKGNTEVLTALKGWVKIKDLKKKDIVWDGEDCYYIEKIIKIGGRESCRLTSQEKRSLECTKYQKFLGVDGNSYEAEQIDKDTNLSFIQDGVEEAPLIEVWQKECTYTNFYALILENSDKYYVRIGENTGILALAS